MRCLSAARSWPSRSMSSRVDLEKLKLDTKSVLESLQKTIKSSDLYTPG